MGKRASGTIKVVLLFAVFSLMIPAASIPSAFAPPPPVIPPSADIDPSVIIGDGSVIGEDVRIKKNTILGEQVIVGDNTRIDKDVTIGDGTTIGQNSKIKKNAIVGSGVTIGDNTTIEKDVVVGDGVVVGNDSKIKKRSVIGNNVNIGDNVKIEKDVVVGDGVVVGNDSKIKKSSVIGDNVNIGDNVKIGKNVVIGDGATILAGSVVPKGTIIPAGATNNCTFTTDSVKKVMKLDADCTTDATITIPDGWTLDGKKKTITAKDPLVGTFVGGVIENAGTTAHVKNLKITTDSLANSCKGGDDRLRGIFFDGASGTITKNEVMNINKGASGCQEGNAIEVRNAPFDGTHPDTQTVTISKNKLTDWQKTGIVANGDVNVVIKKNKVGESATQFYLAANSIQLGFGAIGVVEKNKIDGNQWCGGTSNFAASAILLFLSTDGAKIDKNKIRGNSDIGIFLVADKVTVSKNNLKDKNPDCVNSTFDTGIGDFGVDNILVKNKIKGFDTPIGSEYAHNPYPQPQRP